MTRRNLPAVKAFETPRGVDWDAPSTAFAHWHPVKAASDDANTIGMYDQIGESWDGSGVTSKLVASVLRKAKGDDVTVNINSPGGDFFEGVTIYNMLREYDGIVNVNVIGLAASAASVIAMAADDLKIAKSGFMMIHNSWGLVIGNQNDMRAAADTFATFDSSMVGVYSDRSGVARDDVAAMMDKDTWMTGEDAVEDGFADGFLSSDEVVEDEEKSKSAKHRADVLLAKQGVPRSERRSMLKEISGTHDATPATQNAGDVELANALNSFLSEIRSQ